jgi:NADPH2:quinone reductase
MLAGFYERTGAPREVLQVAELPDPTPGAGEVRVRLRWSGVNPTDVKSRAGLRSSTMPFARIVPHSDGMGVVDAVGGGVSRARLGQRVWIWNAAWQRPFGTAAQYVVLPQEQAVPLPEQVPDEAGACLGIPALTALYAMLADDGVGGRTVLVAGGAGAVGHYAVQFARLLGARRVLATVSSERKAMLAKEAGADVVINYRRDDVAMRVREATDGEGVERIVEVDAAANGNLDLEVARTGAVCVVYGSGAPKVTLPFFPLIVKNLALRFFIVFNLDARDRQRAIATLTAFLERGALTHNIGERVPLPDIARAHELLEAGQHAGNVVLEIP